MRASLIHPVVLLTLVPLLWSPPSAAGSPDLCAERHATASGQIVADGQGTTMSIFCGPALAPTRIDAEVCCVIEDEATCTLPSAGDSPTLALLSGRIRGEAELKPQVIEVPGDPSSAAFFMVAALVVPGSELLIRNVGLNPTRAGLVHVLRQMGGSIEEQNPREVGGEPVADLLVRHSALKGIEVDPAVVPSMVDEFPVLFVAAALAEGTTVTTGLDELRVKESDRIAVMAAALTVVGARVNETENGLTIHGTGGEPLKGGGPIATHLDHRIAMAMAVAGLASRDGVEVDDTRPIATSFPAFQALLDGMTQ